MNKKAVALILSLMVIVVLVILGITITSRSISESNITKRFVFSTKAFWAAEAGIAKAAAQLPNATPVSDDDLEKNNKNNLQYEVPAPSLVEGYTNRWSITSTGRYIVNTSTGEKIERRIMAVAEKPLGPNSDLITNAIETTGSLEILGNIKIIPSEEESAESNSTLNFEAVFGLSKDQVKAMANYTYTNPPSNQQPVDGITWVDLPVDPTTGKTGKYTISSKNWSGSGILIVNGNGVDVALDISGGTFIGVIWVIGKLSISGNPGITGAVFAESDTYIENKLTGTGTLTFSDTDKDTAFNLIRQNIGVNIRSWQEIS